jgi:hypothetical protein
MPLLFDPDRANPETVRSLHAFFVESLEETLELVQNPRGRVIDPASLATAQELVEGALVLLRSPVERDAPSRAREVNVAYAAMIAAIDLVKSHTDMPRVPPPRPSSG